ncbi:MAG: AAA family ATPase [Myxococcota bacterium]
MADIQKIAIYGKGGIGKSVVATSLSVCFAKLGKKVIHIGCDPKADSAVRLMEDGRRPRTVLDVLGDEISPGSPDQVINRGRHGIDVCESGGPPAGLGCGGRGVARTLEFFDDVDVLSTGDYEVAVFDVLGDVVCGGFAAPLRKGFGDKVFIVVSEEPMAMYAANNIASALLVYRRNGVVMGGLIANPKDASEKNRAMLTDFAEKLSTRIVGWIPRDPKVIEAERRRRTVVEHDPESPAALAFVELAAAALSVDRESQPAPTPMEAEEFFDYLERW